MYFLKITRKFSYIKKFKEKHTSKQLTTQKIKLETEKFLELNNKLSY